MGTKRVLIVDDSEIDREILKNMTIQKFDIVEADNGYSALELMLDKNQKLDAVLLDISMPILDGFDVLQIMQEKGIENLPVILITSEATTANVHRAVKYNVAYFISKPYNEKVVYGGLKDLFGDIENYSKDKIVIPNEKLSESDVTMTMKYTSGLIDLFKKYQVNNNRNDRRYVRISNIMRILLKKYKNLNPKVDLDDNKINIISRAAYLCDIGYMAIPDDIISKRIHTPEEKFLYDNHTEIGAKFIELNSAASCRYFVKICKDICINHHERFDSRGFLQDSYDSSIYPQLCLLCLAFDKLFSTRPKFNEKEFDFVANELAMDKGLVKYKVIQLLYECRKAIINYYFDFAR